MALLNIFNESKQPSQPKHSSSKLHQHLKRQSPSPDLTDLYPTQNFTIPIDHFHNESRYAPHTNATFQAHYWLDSSTYVDGGPVIVNALGEDSPYSDLIWLQNGLLHQLANATGGVAVLWGQRYYSGGDIVPDFQYTTENLRFHSTEQAIADLAYFANRVTFPGLEGKNLTAHTTPWIVIGGSYAGAISAFARIQYPDVFWGGISSSGITVGIEDFWQFYDVVRRYGPNDCIAAQQKLTNIFDNIFTSGDNTLITQFKTAFGAQTISSNRNFANILTSPTGAWQGNEWIPSENYPFSGPGTYCANITSQDVLFPSTANLTSTAQSLIAAGGWANETSTLTHPMLNWIGSIRSTYSFCGDDLNSCFSFNSPSPFSWQTCTENGIFATGYVPGSPGHPSALPVVSRIITPEGALDDCRTTYNLSNLAPNLTTFNRYGGFNLSYPRLAISTGEIDIWRPATSLAKFVSLGEPNPRLKTNGTVSEPQIVIDGGGHEWGSARGVSE